MVPNVDLLLVTVNEHETQAVLKAFEKATGEPHTTLQAEKRIYRDLGAVNGTRVFQALSEMGSGGLGASHATVMKAIAALKPSAVVAVGVAFGVDDTKQKIADILVSRQLSLYELQRVSKDKVQFRGDRPHASTWLINYFEGIAQSSWKKIAKVRTGLVLSGDKLVDNIDYRSQLIEHEPEAIGGEMEGAGVYAASQEEHIDWIVVKAICDFADGNKRENKEVRQKKAAKSAADFLIHCLQTVPLTGNAQASNVSPAPEQNKAVQPRKRSRPELDERTDAIIEFFGGSLCNKICLIHYPLPARITMQTAERGMWDVYMRAESLDREGMIAYGNLHAVGRPPDDAVQVIVTRKGDQVSDVEVDFGSLKDRVIGIACDPQERQWIEQWRRQNTDLEFVELINAFMVDRSRMFAYLKDAGLLERPIDAFVFDTLRFDTPSLNSLHGEFEKLGIKLYSARGEASRPGWQVR